MATTNVKVSVVDVGQGQCTFVEVYGDDGKGGATLETLLFDCGSDSHSDKVTVNLTYIASVLAKMDTPAIDCLVFSHSDSDHISLMQTLLEIYKKATDKDLEVKNVWYGGNYDQYEKHGKNILDFLVEEEYCEEDGDVGGLYANYTGIDPGTGEVKEYLWQSADGEVDLFPIVGNVLTAKPDFSAAANADVPERKSAEAKNRVSIVCGLSFKTMTYVICGDATNTTMAAINLIFESAATSLFNNNQMTTIPHHGSRTTGMRADSKSANVRKKAEAIVQRFVQILQSQTYTVSSYQQHEHPSLMFLSLFPPANPVPILQDARLATKNNHLMVVYKDIKVSAMDALAGDYYTVSSESNLFGTDYYNAANAELSLGFNAAGQAVYGAPVGFKAGVAAVNPGACWVYNTDAAGHTTIAGLTHLSDDAAETFTSDAEVGADEMEEDMFLARTKNHQLKAIPEIKSAAVPERSFSESLKVFR